MAGYALDLETVQRLARMLTSFEAGNLQRPQTVPVRSDVVPALYVVQVSSAVRADGTYAASLLYRNGEAYNNQWTAGETVTVRDPNNKALTLNTRYLAFYQGMYLGSGSGSGGSTGSAAGLWMVAGPVVGPDIIQTVVTDVTCSGATLVVTKKTLTIPGGLVA